MDTNRASSVAEIADQLQVNERTVIDEIRRRKLKAHKIGRVWRVFEGDFKKYLESQASVAA